MLKPSYKLNKKKDGIPVWMNEFHFGDLVGLVVDGDGIGNNFETSGYLVAKGYDVPKVNSKTHQRRFFDFSLTLSSVNPLLNLNNEDREGADEEFFDNKAELIGGGFEVLPNFRIRNYRVIEKARIAPRRV